MDDLANGIPLDQELYIKQLEQSVGGHSIEKEQMRAAIATAYKKIEKLEKELGEALDKSEPAAEENTDSD